MASSPPSLFCAEGSENETITEDALRKHLFSFLEEMGQREDILVLPPDFTRFHSQAGKITQFVSEYYGFIKGDREPPTKKGKSEPPTIQILPALGTHEAMSKEQIRRMFGDQLASKDPSPFLIHDWRNDVVTIGHSPSEMVSKATYGMVEEPWPAQLNKLVWEKRKHDPEKQAHKSLVLSIGQVVPHEVMGMANFNKNLFVGVGGKEAINLSHFIGAVHGMEKMMGRASNPLRDILNHASSEFLKELDLWYILTVVGPSQTTGLPELKGLYIGNDIECYNKACDLSLKVNFTILEKPPSRMVVYLDGDEFHSTWLGNKAIYRTRMAIADGGNLVILAPGVKRFGEDDRIDVLIRKYGYVGTSKVMKAMEENKELRDNLSVVAHLIHGSSEGRFHVTYCPGHLSKEDVEAAGFKYGNLEEISKVYDIEALQDGWHTDDNGEFYFIRNPALGLWAVESRFEDSSGKS